MTISGVALLALCTLLGTLLGDLLGKVMGTGVNVGGVGLAMLLLVAARLHLQRRGLLSHGLNLGVEFWAALYIPIVVAMAATQNVVAAVEGGPLVLIAGIVTVVLNFVAVGLISRTGARQETMDEIEARDRRAQHAASVMAGDPE